MRFSFLTIIFAVFVLSYIPYDFGGGGFETADAALATCTLKSNPTTKDDWCAVQTALKNLGYEPAGGFDGKGQIDCKPGPRTSSAIKKYQESKKGAIKADGTWGPDTQRSVCTDLGLQNPQPTTSPQPIGGATPSGGTGAQGYLNNLYVWMLGIVGLSALFAIVAGGVLYIFSGTISSTAQATKYFKNAALGMLIAALSWIILSTINPELIGEEGKEFFDIKGIIEKKR